MARNTFPLVPEDRRRAADRSLVRAILAAGRAEVTRGSSTAIVKDIAPDPLASAFLRVAGLGNKDETYAILEKAAVSPATTSTSTWAAELVGLSMTDLASLSPASSGAQVLRRSLVLEYDRSGLAVVPHLVAAPGAATWVGEAGVIPSRSFSVGSTTLVRNKLAALCSFSRELFEASQPAVERVVRQALNEGLALDIDAALYSTEAASALRPQGLLNGLAAVPASGSTGEIGMLADVGALLTNVAAVSSDIVLVAAVPQAIQLMLRRALFGAVDIYMSSALSAGTIIAAAPSGIAAVMDPAPRFSMSREAVIHEEDATPLAIGTEGSPATVASPVRSMFQSDALSLRMILECDWVRRHDSAISYTTGVAW
jgi:hypothetical protein